MNPYAIAALAGIIYFFGHPVVTKVKHIFHHDHKVVVVKDTTK